MRVVVLLLFLVGAGVAYSLNYHIVTTSSGIQLVPKGALTFEDTFVDVRSWGWTDLWTHRATAMAIVNAGHGSDLPQVQSFNRAVEAGVRTLTEFDRRFGVSETLATQRAFTGGEND